MKRVVNCELMITMLSNSKSILLHNPIHTSTLANNVSDVMGIVILTTLFTCPKFCIGNDDRYRREEVNYRCENW